MFVLYSHNDILIFAALTVKMAEKRDADWSPKAQHVILTFVDKTAPIETLAQRTLRPVV